MGQPKDRRASPANETDVADALEHGRRLFAGPCPFLMTATTLEAVPASALPEVAFAGRSNVGKSSLINALTGRAGLARASNTPGRTRALNFFVLAERLMLVDLPGYGYARADKTSIENWNALIRDYLRGRPPLRRVLLLIDARHGLKPADDAVMDLLDEAAVSYLAVLTKVDKVKPAEAEALRAATAGRLRRRVAAHPDLLLTSAERGEGLPALRAHLAALCERV